MACVRWIGGCSGCAAWCTGALVWRRRQAKGRTGWASLFCLLLLPLQIELETRCQAKAFFRKLGLPWPHAEPSPWLRLCSPRLALPGETFLKASRISLVSSPCSHAQPQDKSWINESSSSRAGNSWLLWQLGLLRICIRLMIFIAQPHLRQAEEISIFPAPSQLGCGGGQEGVFEIQMKVIRVWGWVIFFFFSLNIPLWKRIKKDGEGKGEQKAGLTCIRGAKEELVWSASCLWSKRRDLPSPSTCRWNVFRGNNCCPRVSFWKLQESPTLTVLLSPPAPCRTYRVYCTQSCSGTRRCDFFEALLTKEGHFYNPGVSTQMKHVSLQWKLPLETVTTWLSQHRFTFLANQP